MGIKNNNEENNADNFQINSYILEIHDLTTRVDERVKTVFKQLSETDKKLEKIRDNYAALITKINAIEFHEIPCIAKKIDQVKNDLDSFEDEFEKHVSKLQRYENYTKELKSFKKTTEEKLKSTFDIVFKVIMTLVSAYIIYSLGWNK